MSVIEREEASVETPLTELPEVREMNTTEKAKLLLQRALARLQRRGGWIEGSEAETPFGKFSVEDLDDDQFKQAYAFCSIGAIFYEARREGWGGSDQETEALKLLADAINPKEDHSNRDVSLEEIVEYNDCSSRKTRVINRFKKALSL